MMAEVFALSEANQVDFQCPVPNVTVGSSNSGISIRTSYGWLDICPGCVVSGCITYKSCSIPPRNSWNYITSHFYLNWLECILLSVIKNPVQYCSQDFLSRQAPNFRFIFSHGYFISMLGYLTSASMLPC